MKSPWKPEAIIKVRLKTPEEGGRTTAISGEWYGCPVKIEGECFDCRIGLGGGCLELGETYELPVNFLSPNLVLPLLKEGLPITLWEGKDIAEGIVVRICDKNKP